MIGKQTLVNDFNVSAQAGLGGGGKSTLVALEGLEFEVDCIEVSLHIGCVVGGIVATIIRAVAAENPI